MPIVECFFFDVHMFLSVFRFLLHLQLLYGLSGTSLREGQWEIPGGFHEKSLAGSLGHARHTLRGASSLHACTVQEFSPQLKYFKGL